MLISDLRKIIVNRPLTPCQSGLEWFDELSKNHKYTTSFFKSLKNEEKTPLAYTPYGYLVWIFWHCLDWTEIIDNDYCLFDNNNYILFMQSNFNINCALEMETKDLCEALVRAFK